MQILQILSKWSMCLSCSWFSQNKVTWTIKFLKVGSGILGHSRLLIVLSSLVILRKLISYKCEDYSFQKWKIFDYGNHDTVIVIHFLFVCVCICVCLCVCVCVCVGLVLMVTLNSIKYIIYVIPWVAWYFYLLLQSGSGILAN